MKRKKCNGDEHTAGPLSHNNEHLVCDKCQEVYEMDLSKWNPVTLKGQVRIIEHGEWGRE